MCVCGWLETNRFSLCLSLQPERITAYHEVIAQSYAESSVGARTKSKLIDVYNGTF